MNGSGSCCRHIQWKTMLLYERTKFGYHDMEIMLSKVTQKQRDRYQTTFHMCGTLIKVINRGNTTVELIHNSELVYVCVTLQRSTIGYFGEKGGCTDNVFDVVMMNMGSH